MRKSSLAVLVAAAFAMPLVAAACSEGPTSTARPPEVRLECDPTNPAPPDSTCRSGQMGSGGRTCC
jgi:hypothetical protein